MLVHFAIARIYRGKAVRMIPFFSFYLDDYDDDGDSLFYRNNNNNKANIRRLTGHSPVKSLSEGYCRLCVSLSALVDRQLPGMANQG